MIRLLNIVLCLGCTNNKYIESIVNPESKLKKITEIVGIHPDMFENKKNIYHHIPTIYYFNDENIDSVFNVKEVI